jgi:iron complex outermembrane recepter protein
MVLAKKHLFTAASGLALALTCQGTAAFAQETPAETEADSGLEEIIVTATKSETNLQDTPVSVQTIAGEDLATDSVAELRDAMKDVPGVIFTSQGNFGLRIAARGVGPGVLNGQGGVSTLYDGVFSASPMLWRVGFYDINRIETLLGPQGTLYGKNAQGGVINLVTNNPKHEFGADLTAGIGNYDLVNVQGAVNVPLGDMFALRVAGSYNDRGGYLSNGQNDNGTWGLRGKLLFEPTDDLSILLGAEHYEIDEAGQAPVAGFTTPTRALYTVTYSDKQYYRKSADRIWMETNADLGFAKLTVIPAYFNTKEEEQATRIVLPFNAGFSQISFGQGNLKELSIEARLASQPSSPVQWIVGGYYYDSRDFNPGDGFSTAADILQAADGTLSLRAGALDDVFVRKQSSSGVFAQVTVPLTERFRVIGGLRYSKDTGSQYSNGVGGIAADVRSSWSHTDWRAGLQYDLSDNSMVYASIATGYRPGGFSPAAPFPAYGIEESTTYEFGSKNEFFDRTLRLNFAVYYNDYRGFQQSIFEACTRTPLSNPTNLPLCVSPGGPPVNLTIQNVAKLRVFGGEASVVWAPTDADRFTANVSFNDSRINSALLIGLPPSQVNVQGARLPNAPVWAGNFSYAHDFSLFGGKLTPEVSARYQGEVNLVLPATNLNNIQGGVWRWDASLSFAPDNGRWSVNLWARNLSNEIVKASANGAAFYLDAPKTYGASVSVHF